MHDGCPMTRESGAVQGVIRQCGGLEAADHQGDGGHQAPRDGALLVSESDDPLEHIFGWQRILDQERRVLWRPADAVEPPLYPAALSELIVSRPAGTGPMDSGPSPG
jgi:hypothetical protein